MPGRKAPEAERREQILQAAFKVATRERLDGVTIRAIAKQAKLSSGLISFYFGNREGVILALLDWLLERTLVPEATSEVSALPTAEKRLLGFIEHELDLLPERKPSLELFFDYWVLGFRKPRVRSRIRRAQARYRNALASMADEVVEERPDRFTDVSGKALAQLVFSVIAGCVMQAIMDPRSFDHAEVLDTIASVLARG